MLRESAGSDLIGVIVWAVKIDARHLFLTSLSRYDIVL